jgi:hypothetical protein
VGIARLESVSLRLGVLMMIVAVWGVAVRHLALDPDERGWLRGLPWLLLGHPKSYVGK